jgi:predicted site-specific integrase-resolvase
MIHTRIINDVIYLDREGVATILNIAPHTLAVWKNTGRRSIPHTRPRGNKILYKLSDIEQFFATWDEAGYEIYIKQRRSELFKGIPATHLSRT